MAGDLALVNGRLITIDDMRPEAEAALVRDGRITRVGTTGEVLGAANGAPVFDCGGRAVVPGFIDGHAHFEMTCCALTHCHSLTTPPYTSLASLADAIHERVSATPTGEWVIVRSSFNLYTRMEEKRLFTRQELDAISEQHPIVVLSSLHIAMLNTPALRALDLWDGDQPLGVVLHRAENGTPTGVVTEIWDLLPVFSVDQVKTAIRRHTRDLFLAHGITTIHNLPYSAEDILAVQELQASGELPIRFRMHYHVPHQIELNGLLAMGLKPGFGNDQLRYGGVKIFVDGVGHDGYGQRVYDLRWAPDELLEFICRVHAAGQQLWMHVCSQPAIRVICDAVEEALRRQPRADHRHRIEHAADYLIDEGDMRRVASLGIRVITTPVFIYQQGDTLSLPGSQRWPRQFRLRTLIEQGFEVIGSSDTTGSIPDGIPPLYNMACAVTRRTLSGGTYLPEEAISVGDALKLFTIWPARGAFEEHDKGSITVGKLGDFAVLSADPREVEPDALFDLRVEVTIIGGEVVWER
ncbi:MAG TPA: amidohydrolase [Thermomicrobiales bacterium]|nr:amidohydrolase [Thermomicrobiales bacterium]